jgi:hypothetical protein
MLSDTSPPQDSPDQDTVVQMVRHAVGPRLDAIEQATRDAKEANRVRELAKWAGDHEAETAITQALNNLAAAART